MSDLGDLNDVLFEALGRLTKNNGNLRDEIKRAHAISGVASQIISNATLMLKAKQLQENGILIPTMIQEKRMIPNYKDGGMYEKVPFVHRR